MIKLPFSNSLFFNNKSTYQNYDKNNSNLIVSNNNIPLLDKPKFENIKGSSEPFSLDILGFKLELDDLIILGLMFFLYQEGVKDELLYIALLLILLS